MPAQTVPSTTVRGRLGSDEHAAEEYTLRHEAAGEAAKAAAGEAEEAKSTSLREERVFELDKPRRWLHLVRFVCAPSLITV